VLGSLVRYPTIVSRPRLMADSFKPFSSQWVHRWEPVLTDQTRFEEEGGLVACQVQLPPLHRLSQLSPNLLIQCPQWTHMSVIVCMRVEAVCCHSLHHLPSLPFFRLNFEPSV
jgi:hypothetical protein